MTKTLVKKQLLELFQGYFLDKKTGKGRKPIQIFGFFILFAVILGSVSFAFYGISNMMGDAFINVGLSWLFFGILGITATLLGLFGSVFNTYSGLYNAKDNELMLSMPIPPTKLLISRMVSIYLMSLLYSAVGWVPTCLYFWINGGQYVTAPAVIFDILLLFVIPIFVSALSCVIGYLVALIAQRTKNKTFATVFLSLFFMIGYYVVYFKINTILTEAVKHGEEIAVAIKKYAFPFYEMAQAATGEVLPFVIFTLISVVLFALVYFVISINFVKLITTNKGSKKKVYKAETSKVSSVKTALLKKEFSRFINCAPYILNAGLGDIVMPIGAIAIIVKRETIKTGLAMLPIIMPELDITPSLIITFSVFLISSMNDFTAPSISLEGKNIWILQSVPVPTIEILRSKINFHNYMTAPFAILLDVVAQWALGSTTEEILYSAVAVLAFVYFSSTFGLFANLKFPNLDWTSETAAIKQGASPLVAIFGGWGIIVGLAALYIFGFSKLSVDPNNYYLALFGILCVARITCYQWIQTKGVKVFEEL